LEKTILLAKGYTLIELMVVVAIIGIVGSIAYPSYQGYACDTYKAQAVADLRVCALQMDRHYSNNFAYTGAAIDGTPASTCPNSSPAEGTKKFDISLFSVSAQDFKIRAVPAAGQSCGTTIEVGADGTLAEL
jgi:type IV pilus assembly protein PilE